MAPDAWARFWRVTFPLLSPTMLFLIVINTINSFQIFAEPRVLTQGGPGDASRSDRRVHLRPRVRQTSTSATHPPSASRSCWCWSC